MAITNQQQSDILKVVVGLFNAAPGGTYMTDLAAQVEAGTTIAQLADGLAANTVFTNGIMAGKVTTASQVAVLLNNFGLAAGNADPASAAAQAEFFFTTRIDDGVGIGAIVYEAVTFLSATTEPAFLETATLLANKALVAASYSASNSSLVLSTLQNVVDNVTGTAPYTDADVATVLASINDTTAPVVTEPTENFSFAEGQGAAATLATVAATDNIAVSAFNIVSGNDSGFFAIDATGNITLTEAGLTSAANDFETAPNSFTLGVTAKDAANNVSAAVNVVLDVSDVDEVAPALSAQVIAGNKVILTFDEAFDAASIPAGSSFLVTESGTTNIAISAVTVSGQIVTLTLATTPTGTTTVSYTPPGTSPLQDAAGNDADAFTDKTLTVDTTAPTLSSSTPADNGTSIAIADNLVLTFSEAVQAGTGNIVITNASDATDTRTIAVTDTTQVTFSGSTVTINPTADLQAGASYNVQIATTAVKDAASNTYAGITNSTSLNFSTVGAPAATFALTVNTDTISGTSANESIDGSSFISTAGTRVQTLNNADRIDGGAGTDTLTVQLSAAATVTPASLVNIENLTVEFIAADTLNLINGDNKLLTINSSNNAAAATINNIQSNVATINLSNTTNTFTTTTTNSLLAGASDVLGLNLSNVTGAAAISIGTVTAGSGYETLNIASNGAIANSITFTDNLATGLTKANVTGAQNLTLSLLDTSITSVDASAATGTQALTIAAGTGVVNVKGSSTANSTVAMNGSYTVLDTITGGAGTADILVLTNAEATGATVTQSLVSAMDIIALSDTADGTVVTVSNFPGATGLQLGATGVAVNQTGNVAATFAAGTNSFNRQASTDNGNETTTLTTSGVATTDILNVTLGTAAAASTWNGTGAFTINGSETVNIFVQGGAATIGGALTLTNTATTESAIITGNQDLTITGITTADAVNASGMTGTAALIMTGGGGANSMTITGTGNADTLIGGSAADIITGGSGNDVIQNAISGANSAAQDILTGGAGFDSYRLIGSSASAANLNGSSFVTEFTVGSTATTTDILVLDITEASYGAGTNLEQGGGDLAATAAGAATTIIQTVAQNATAAAIVAGADLIKLSTGVAFTTNLQTTFNNAIGSATVTGITTAGAELFGMLYDTTNARAVVFMVDAVSTGTQTIETGDTVTLVGSISMSSTDYASFNSNNLAFVDF